MSFYHNGQPALGAYRHPDAGFTMNPYPHHEQQPNLAPAPSAGPPVYPFVDPSGQAHMYHRQSYGDVVPVGMGAMEHGVWQPPQAPRLTAAAARAGRQQMMGYAPSGYPSHGATPWYAQALGVSQPYQQPRTHQQLEHQLLVQHHLAKAHERQNGSSVYQPPFGPAGFSNHAQHHPHSRPHHQHLQHHYHHQPYRAAHATAHHPAPAPHEHHAERQPRYQDNRANEAYQRSERSPEAAREWSGWNQALPVHRASVSYLPHQDQMYPNHPQIQSAHRHSEDAALLDSAAWAQHNAARASQPHVWDQAPHYPQHSYAEAGHSHDAYRDMDAVNRSRHEYLDQRSHFYRHQDRSHDLGERHREEQFHAYAPMRSSHPDAWHPTHGDAHRAHANESRSYAESNQWQQAESRHQAQDDAAPSVADEQEPAPVDAAADQAQPAPSSPDSLEKSALPIAAIGAQLIWNACTALFDPELLIEAHETSDEAMEEDCDEAMSPAAVSAPSSSSTPSLNTPDISPWSSTVLERPASDSTSSGDWNAFRSPFGPDRLPQLRPQAHSFTFGSDNASSHHDLHRMAVGAERARSALARDVSPAKRSRQGSGQSEAATVHSSGASTASSSEPGTPASLAHESPALSSTVSAHSAETARSPLRASLGMSLDRSRSESAIRARRNSSKTSPKLASSKWSGRIRDNVLAVLRLVSPDWRWSNNDHLFVSLSESLAPASAAAAAKASNSQGQGRSGRDSVTSIVTSYANEPSPAFRRFVHQVLAQTLLSPTAFLLGILNSLRLLIMAQLPDGSIDPVVLELFAQPTSAAPFKLFTLGMMIANKHLDDNTFLNKTWNEVTGIPLAELNQTEAWFLKKCNYEVTVPDETWIGFLNRLQSWEEKRSSRGMHRDQDSSKRLLLVLDEALSHFDAIPTFQLDGDMTHSVEHTKSASPMDMWAKSHHRAGSLALLDADQQHCRSAPAVATLLSHKAHSHGAESYVGPNRPSHISRASLAVENPSATLLRSSSEYMAADGSFKDLGSLSDSGKSQNGTMSGPLMPSALLNGSRALFHHHGGMFGALATSGWAHH
ncbi:uncharacterized protein UTRI_05047 [Ustilago trichophora]|uniref:Cyclin N-terminal domain-containing protein n=1 Tax=Ustilago trichophora TaxID=86804 RepID=A0A5C3EB38_9BASI|nr:uncharacterized protein UTRI_05047 [Ustilago trichophora]